MLVVPDPATANLDPFTEAPTLVLICNISDPITGQSYSRDAATSRRRPTPPAQNTNIADAAYFGPELETSSSTGPLRPGNELRLLRNRRCRGELARR